MPSRLTAKNRKALHAAEEAIERARDEIGDLSTLLPATWGTVNRRVLGRVLACLDAAVRCIRGVLVNRKEEDS